MLISRLPFRRVRCCHVVGGVLVCAVAAVGGGRAWCQSGPAVVPAQAPPPSVPLPALPTVVGGDHTVVRSVSGLFMNRDDGFFARVGGLGDGNGVAVGGGYRLSTSEGMLTTRAMVSHREAYLVSADWRHRLDRDGRWAVSIGVSERRDAQQLFSGLGPDTTGVESGFALTTRTADVSAHWQAAPWLKASFGIAAVNPSLSRSTNESVLPLESSYSPADAAGMTLQPTFGVLHASLQVDTRRRPEQATWGRYAVSVKQYDDRADAGYAFRTVTLELEQNIALGTSSRVLAFRGIAQQATPARAAAVPFYFQPAIGGNRSLRGYDRQRFRDRSAFFLQSEFRQRVHTYAAAAAFFDVGQVGPSLSALRAGSLLTSYGVGLIVGKEGSGGLRTDLAFGGDVPVRLVVGYSTGF